MPDQMPWEKYKKPEETKPDTGPESGPWSNFQAMPSSNIAPNTPRPDATAPTPPGFTAKNIIGAGSNAANMAYSGAQLGKFLPIPGAPWSGAALGGVGGAALSAFMPPSQTPGTDIGATIGGAFADRFFPGSGTMGRAARFGRGLVTGGIGTMAGAFLGSLADQAGGFVKDAPTGKILFYGGAGALGSGLKGFTAPSVQPGYIGQAADQLEKITGTDIPTSLPQSTGRFGAMSDWFSGTSRAKELAQNQSKAAIETLNTLAGGDLKDVSSTVETVANDVKETGRAIWKQMFSNWKNANATTTTKNVPTSLVNPDGTPMMTQKTVTSLPDEIDWQSFAKMHGLDQLHINALNDLLNNPTVDFVDQFLTGKGEATPAVGALKSLLKILPPNQTAQLRTALTLRAIDKAGAIVKINGNDIVNGQTFSKALQAGALKEINTPDQIAALQKLGDVMKAVDPLANANPSRNAAANVMRYLVNKQVFTVAGATGGAIMGAKSDQNANLGTRLGETAIGGVAGATAMFSLKTLLGAVMTNPKLADVLVKVSKGDADAANALIRTISTGVYTEMNSSKKNPAPATPAARMQGFFQR
jgi:hypothetical protein